MRRFGQIIFIFMFLGTITIIPLLTGLQSKQVISEFEYRRLAVVPVLSKASILTGEYFAQWETYMSDHLAGRNLWIKSYTYMNMIVLGKSKINNIILAEDGFLLPNISFDGSQEEVNRDANLDIMTNQLKELKNRLAKYGGSFYFVGVPSQASYHKEKYPKHLKNINEFVETTEKNMFGRLEALEVPYINMNKIFRSKPEIEYYYKTDHHFNFEGAYATYYEIINKIKKDNPRVSAPIEKEDLDIVTLKNPFGGSRNRQIYFMMPTQEKIKIAYPKNKIPYEKLVNGKLDNRLYYTAEDASSFIAYSVYMGGDWAETIIRTNNYELPNLLVFGDSFTNALEPLLFNHFNETRILDLRHYNEMSLFEYVDKYKPDVVVMVRDDLNYGSLVGNGNIKGLNIKK